VTGGARPVRRIVLQMMTTLDGRLDDPLAWVHDVADDQYRAIERFYATYDTVLVGRTTYEEMAAYWPGALDDEAGTETNRAMARRMRDCRKVVFSRSGDRPLTEWHNVEQLVVSGDDELARRLTALKAQPGADIHLSGGASFAQSVVALGLVDEFRFFVYPVASRGASWHSALPDGLGLRLLDATAFGNGVVGLRYAPREAESGARPAGFADLLT
jgi:dihydrofolate reductase